MASDVTAEQRRQMIAEAAYFRAQRRGFQGGNPVEDWLAAEAEIERVLGQEANRMSITKEELDQLMAKARESQLELFAEALRIKLERAAAGDSPTRSNGEDSHVSWDALRAALRSISAERE